jgi:hypothetical protein
MCSPNRIATPKVFYEPCTQRLCQNGTDGHGNVLGEDRAVIAAVCSRKVGREMIAVAAGPGYQTSPQCSLALTLVGNQPLAETDQTANPDVLRGVNDYNDFLRTARDMEEEEGPNGEILGMTAHDFVMNARGISEPVIVGDSDAINSERTCTPQ